MKNRVKNITILKTPDRKRYYKALKYPNIPLSINDIYVITTSGDRLDLLANQFYKDTRLWWIIANANPEIVRRDSFNLKPGLEVRIPTNTTKILNDFEQLNK
jgi:nucleoid-associated protein YgaU